MDPAQESGACMSSPSSLDLQQAAILQRALVSGELAWDMLFGINLGFYRTFAIPSIARTLAGSGELVDAPAARAKATGDMMYVLFKEGLESERGKQVIGAMNRMHSRFDISQDEFRYVLACFEVAPMRWCDRRGSRATTDAEKAAAHTFYLALAERMDIRDVPATWHALAAWMDAYEREHFAPTEEAAALWNATRDVLTNRAPKVLAPVVRSCADAMLDPPLRRVVGAGNPTVSARVIAPLLLRLAKANYR
ncbi:oxygenase MpaB family protein [Streptomyces sp. ODS28]|uniref:oxygenase MpaB family protein n=1 Tax=Streptomyces sp. ODS28 TaxID=3136688 RepID=UPI0031EC43AC